ncbi:unnamed protein product [Amoebophrya sp. A25]|nr:unnamed protein product [Amoebophrya sp. A25]|eukprot:GSA25T00023682001.1
MSGGGAQGFRIFLVDGEDSDKKLAGSVTFHASQKERDISSLLGQVFSLSDDVPRAEYTLVAVENGRRVPLTDDQVATSFFQDAVTAYPMIELHKSNSAKEQEDVKRRKSMRKDQVDMLENENRELKRGAQLVERKMEEFKAETKRQLDEIRGVLVPIERNVKQFMSQIEVDTAESRCSMEVKMQNMQRITEETSERATELERNFKREVGGFQSDVLKLTSKIAKLSENNAESEEQRNNWLENIKKGFQSVKESVSESTRDVGRLKSEKLDVSKFQAAVDTLTKRCESLESELKVSNDARDKIHRELLTRIDADTVSNSEAMQRLDHRVRQDMTNMEARRKAYNEELDQLLELRLAEIRAVVGKVEGEKADILEVEDVRAGVSTELKTLENGLAVVNGKYDVVKKEHDEFVEVHQNRVAEFEKEFGKALVQTKLEFQLESQKTEEGYLASTKMLNVLQKELGDFVTQNGRHISLLQHEHQGLKEGILLLDSAKNTMSKNMKSFVGDYQGFVDEQDIWNEDATKKITNILQAMQPTKLEWRIEAISRKLADVGNTPCIRSESFRLNSVPDLRLDFFLEGLDSRIYQEGVSAVRLYAPKGSKFKYEVAIGRICDGTKIFEGSTSEGLFWVDLFFPDWQSEISLDTITISCEIVENMLSPAGQAKMVKLRTE